MTTKLDGSLRREIAIEGEPWIVTLSPEGLKLARKRKRKGVELLWKELVTGDAALAAALNASVNPALRPRPARPPAKRRRGEIAQTTALDGRPGPAAGRRGRPVRRLRRPAS